MSSSSIYVTRIPLPYVYRVTHRHTKQFYIGVRYANTTIAEEDLWKTYFTSSKKVAALGYDNFEAEVLAEFFDRSAALEFEKSLIKEHWNSHLRLNGNIGGKQFDIKDPTILAKIRANMKIAFDKPDVIAKKSASGKKKWLDEDYKERQSLAIRASHNTDEVLAKKSEISKELWKNPAYRAKRTATIAAKKLFK